MKKLLWTSAMALAAVACLTACDDTSSSSYEIPTYKSDTTLPDTCSMEVAKVDTAYYACFENKWVEVTDSATVEQLKEGLDEEEIKAKLEELETLLVKPANNTPKPTSSSAQSEVEGSDDEEDSSSSSEEEEEYSSSSKKKKNKDKDDSGSGSGEGGSGSGEETVKKCGDVTYDPKTQVCGDGDKVLPKCGKSGYDPETQVCGEGNQVLSKCGESGYDPKTQYCKDGTTPMDLSKCGETTYNPEDRFCYADEHVFDKCGTKSYNVLKEYCEGNAVKSYVITKSADVVEIGETLIVEINKVFSATVALKAQDESYVGYTSVDNGTGGLKISVTNKEALATGTKTVTLNIVMNNQGYVFVTPVELNVAPKTATCGTKQYSTKTQFCDTRGSGTVYKKVTIGTQTWMAENLNYVTGSGSICRGTKVSGCEYGRFYTKAVALSTTTPICPSGWHLPSVKEVKTLVAKVDGVSSFSTNNTAGKKLKTQKGWTSGDGTDIYGFSLVPAGYTNSEGEYSSEGLTAMFWLSDISGSYYYYVIVGGDEALTIRDFAVTAVAERNVRCIKD